jgi:selenide,water dikinase
MSELAQVLRHLVPVRDPNALVDASTGDDAAVYLIAEERALVVTADFFTPIVDDPFDFGRIAAANALSDVYAMGARPLFALNLVGFPRGLLKEGILDRIVEGGGEVCREAGIPVLGGHSIDDPEPKFGLVAVGEAPPSRLTTTAGFRAGDRLILTKPLGTGVIATAIRDDKAPGDVVRGAVEVMATLNRGAAEAMSSAGVRGATDVTGFGLLGHLRTALRASGVAATLVAAAVPLLDGAVVLAEAGHVPGGTRRNLEDLAPDIVWEGDVEPVMRTLLVDAQTSGGMLIAVPPDRLPTLLEALRGRAPVRAVIGEVVPGRPGSISVR